MDNQSAGSARNSKETNLVYNKENAKSSKCEWPNLRRS